MKTKFIKILPLLTCVLLLFCGCSENKAKETSSLPENYIASVNHVPDFDGVTPYVVIKNNQPDFKEEDLVINSYENYQELDELGRCTEAIACIGKDLMPTEERGSIGMVKPSGWHTVKYENIDGKYLYNRCHLIGFQLTGENANECNLITGTRYLNIEGMLPFENMVADYVKETENHVLYRVTPIFDKNNLLARGVQIEAKSIEDNGEGICFNVYAYNNQPGIAINYETGDSAFGDVAPVTPPKQEDAVDSSSHEESNKTTYILNMKSKKIHLPSCDSVNDIFETNKEISTENMEILLEKGYVGCKKCNP